MKWTRLVALVIVAIVLGMLAGMWWVSRRQDAEATQREQQLRDSLGVLGARYTALSERERVAVVTLQVSNRLLDSALGKAPVIVYVPRTRTIVTREGRDSSAVDSLPYVAKADYDTLASRCSNLQRDCATVVALKDSLLTVRSGEAATLHGLIDVGARRLDVERRRNRLVVLRGFGIGLGAGALGCALLCR